MGNSQTSFTAAGIRRGFLVAQPLAPGVLLYGVVFGVLASERGLSWLEAVLMSAFVYSGTAQLAALQAWTASPALLPLFATVLIVNARYILYGAALRPWLSQTTPGQAFATLFFLGDGNWVLSMKEYMDGKHDAGFILGSGAATFLPWILGTVAGHVAAYRIPDPRVFGLDFMLIAFAAAIGMSVWRGKVDLWPAVAAAITAVTLQHFLPGGWYIVGAGLAGAVVGALRHAD